MILSLTMLDTAVRLFLINNFRVLHSDLASFFFYQFKSGAPRARGPPMHDDRRGGDRREERCTCPQFFFPLSSFPNLLSTFQTTPEEVIDHPTVTIPPETTLLEITPLGTSLPETTPLGMRTHPGIDTRTDLTCPLLDLPQLAVEEEDITAMPEQTMERLPLPLLGGTGGRTRSTRPLQPDTTDGIWVIGRRAEGGSAWRGFLVGGGSWEKRGRLIYLFYC